MSECSSEATAKAVGAPEIELTPAMIKAGVDALIWLDQDLDSSEVIVEKVVAATLAAGGWAAARP